MHTALMYVLATTGQCRSVHAGEGQPLTLVCTDVEGSTELWEWDNEAMMLVRHRDIYTSVVSLLKVSCPDCLACIALMPKMHSSTAQAHPVKAEVTLGVCRPSLRTTRRCAASWSCTTALKSGRKGTHS